MNGLKFITKTVKLHSRHTLLLLKRGGGGETNLITFSVTPVNLTTVHYVYYLIRNCLAVIPNVRGLKNDTKNKTKGIMQHDAV